MMRIPKAAQFSAILYTAIAMTGSVAVAAEFDPSNSLTCSIGNLSECSATGCDLVTNENVNAPQFMKINLKKKSLQSIANGQARSSKLQGIEVTADEILLSGSQTGNERFPKGFSYSINISITTGNLAFAVASDEIAFTGFGACMLDD